MPPWFGSGLGQPFGRCRHHRQVTYFSRRDFPAKGDDFCNWQLRSQYIANTIEIVKCDQEARSFVSICEWVALSDSTQKHGGFVKWGRMWVFLFEGLKSCADDLLNQTCLAD